MTSRSVSSLPSVPAAASPRNSPRVSGNGHSVGIVVVRPTPSSSTTALSTKPSLAPPAPLPPPPSDAAPWWVWVFGVFACIYGFNLIIAAALTDWSRTVTLSGAAGPTYLWPLALAPLATGAVSAAGAATCWRDAQARMMRMGLDVTRDAEAVLAMPMLTLAVVGDGAVDMRFTELASLVALSVVIVLTSTSSDYVARGDKARIGGFSPSLEGMEGDAADARLLSTAGTLYRFMPVLLHAVAFLVYGYIVLAVPRDADAQGAGVQYAMRVVLVATKVVHILLLAALSFVPSPRDYLRLNVVYYGAQCATRGTLAMMRLAA